MATQEEIDKLLKIGKSKPEEKVQKGKKTSVAAPSKDHSKPNKPKKLIDLTLSKRNLKIIFKKKIKRKFFLNLCRLMRKNKIYLNI